MTVMGCGQIRVRVAYGTTVGQKVRVYESSIHKHEVHEYKCQKDGEYP